MAEASAPPMDVSQYLAEKNAASPPMDVNKYLAEKNGTPASQKVSSWLDTNLPGGTARGYIKGALKSLPTLGMVGGGILGTPADILTGPAGTIAGAGIGGFFGKTLQNLGEKTILGEDKNREELYLDPIKEGLMGAAAEGGGMAIGKGLEMAAGNPLVRKGLSKIGTGASKVGEMFTGVPEKEIQTYAKHSDEIKNMAKASNNSTAEAADQMRSNWDKATQDTRRKLSERISSSLDGNQTRISAKPVLESLERSKANIDPDYYPEQIGQIDDMIQKLNAKVTPAGRMSIQDANATKGFLQDKASSAYRNNGDIFNVGSEAAKGARSGGAEIRSSLNKAAPDIAISNDKLAGLHDLEDNMNMNMVREGKPEAGILAAGSGGNARNAKALQELGDASGHDMLGDAQKLAAMRTFGSPKLMAADVTGKSVGRMGLAGGLGFLFGGVPGGIAASALTSPAALRMAIDGGKLSAEAIQQISQTPGGRALIGKAMMSPWSILKGENNGEGN